MRSYTQPYRVCAYYSIFRINVTKTGDYLIMKKNPSKLSKKALDVIAKVHPALPTKTILLDMLADACYLLSGLGCNELEIDTPDVQLKVVKICGMTSKMMREIKDDEESQRELAKENSAMMEKIVNGIDVETLEEIMTSYKEFRESGGDRDDTIDVIVNTVRAKRGEA